MEEFAKQLIEKTPVHLNLTIKDKYTLLVTYDNGHKIYIRYLPDDMMYQYYTCLDKPDLSIGYNDPIRSHCTFDGLVREIVRLSVRICG
jgi:hypothetical protein